MNDSPPRCPKCKDSNYALILYGYAMSSDVCEGMVYGGVDWDAESPTHMCQACKSVWRDEKSSPLLQSIPKFCHFCPASLSEADKFTFMLEFEDRIDQNQVRFWLTDDAFSTNLYPVCSDCRKGIKENIREQKQEKAVMEDDRIFGFRILIGCATFVAIWLALLALCEFLV